MLSVIAQYWIWMSLAGGLGVLIAVLSFYYMSKSVFNSVMIGGAVIFAVGLMVAIAKMVGGRPGFYLEVALLLVACYFVGSLLGGVFTGNFPPRYSGWWVGLILVALIGTASIIFARTDIENDIRARTGIAMKREGGNTFDFDVAGRDVLLHVDVSSPEKRDQLADIILNLPGVRLVLEVKNFTGEAAEMRAKALDEISARETAAKAASEKAAQETAAKAAAEKAAQEVAAKAASEKAAQEAAAKTASEKAAQEAAAKAASERAAQEAAVKAASEKASQEAAAKAASEKASQEAAAKAASEKASQEAAAKAASEKASQEAAAKAASEKAAQEAAARGASEKAAQEAAAKAAAEKAALEAAAKSVSDKMVQEATARVNAEQASQCRAELFVLKSRELVTFDIESAVISDRFDGVLKKIQTILSYCPSAQIEVSGHADTSGRESFNESLSQKRAQAGLDYLIEAGVAASRLSAAGYGESLPFKSNATPQGRRLNRRIEFSIR